MKNHARRLGLLLGLGTVGAALGCSPGSTATGEQSSWSALMDDGDATTMTGAMASAAPTPPPPRFCSDCTREPLAFWMFDDCNTQSTELADSARTSSISHPAFRAVSAACVAGIDGLAVRLSGKDDIVYAPDQPDFLFDQGLTIAAWINPDVVTGTQSIVRKRLDGTSAFTLAIDGKRLTFVVRLTNGRLVGVTAPVQAKRFTHVAATYDGQQVLLYVNGTLADKARATGKIALGVGPIFVGNDADGRRFKGIVDDVWLNTFAAPADVVQGLTCIRKPPIVALSPGQTPPEPAGTTVPFDLAVTNPGSPSCPSDSFEFFASSLPPPLSTDTFFGFLSAGPGETAHATVNVTAFDTGASGAFAFQYTVFDTASFNLQATAEATYIVAPPAPPSRTGCAPVPTHPVAPGGYYVNGNTVCTADGRPHLFHGVDRPSLEFLSTGQNLSQADFRLMASWNANVVRIALNQDFWIAESPIADPNYISVVDSAVRWAEIAGMDVVLDLHWSDRGVLGSCNPASGCQQQMADVNSMTFWNQVANRYKDDGRVMFELYNEPHDVSWEVWRSGGDTGNGWQAVGMQQLYDTVRATGAQNAVIIGGLDFAYDLSGVPANRIDGYNILYATHPYRVPGAFQREPANWNQFWGFLTRTDAVVATEFGDLTPNNCTADYAAQVIQFADAHFAGWTSWAWFVGGCGFPSLIEDWAATPSLLGAVVKPALLGYDDPPSSPPRSGGGSGASDIDFVFDVSTEGWNLNNFDGGGALTNLGAVLPAGVPAPTLRFGRADGDPISGPGSLKLTVTFTALDQFVDPVVSFGQPGINASGKTLHMMVRRVSGSFPEGSIQFHAGTGPSFVFAGSSSDASGLPLGEWVPLTLDLGAAATATVGFDPAHLVQIGIQFFSGFSGAGATFTGSGEMVFEVDTVTD